MAQTIELDDDFISADELKLMQTKQTILAKLRVRFGEVSGGGGWPPTQQPGTVAVAGKTATHRGG
jgi:hypothetical protein